MYSPGVPRPGVRVVGGVERQRCRRLAGGADDNREVARRDVVDGLARGVLDDHLDRVVEADVGGLVEPARGEAVRPELLDDVGAGDADEREGENRAGAQGDDDRTTTHEAPLERRRRRVPGAAISG